MSALDEKYTKSLKYTRNQTVTFVTPVLGVDADSGKVDLTSNGHLTVYVGFQYDGPTFLPDVKALMEEAAVHDAFYHLMRGGWLPLSYKEAADNHFYVSIMREDGFTNGVPKWRAKIYRKALQLFGHLALKG